MLQHLQQPKPKNVLQIWLVTAKENKKTSQKHQESVLLKGDSLMYLLHNNNLTIETKLKINNMQ